MNTGKQILLGIAILAVVTLLQFFQRPVESSALITESKSQSFSQDIQQTDWVLVDVYTDWCAPCKAQQPALNRLAEKEDAAIKIVKLNGDNNPAQIQELEVKGYPTLILFHKGAEVDRLVGKHSYRALENWLGSPPDRELAMIVHLRGLLCAKYPTRAIVETGGLGYEIFIPLSSYDRLPSEGDEVKIFIHHHLREDAEILFGFMTEAERELFQLLLSVSGIGPKIALSALSGLTPRDLKSAVISGDVKRLSSVSGIGKKMAERMVVELKDKFSKADMLELTSEPEDASENDIRLRDAGLALIALGYKQADARKMLERVSQKADASSSVEDLVRLALTQ